MHVVFHTTIFVRVRPAGRTQGSQRARAQPQKTHEKRRAHTKKKQI